MQLKAPRLKAPMSGAALAGGIAAVICIVGFVFWMQRGAHIDLKGSVLKVRTQAMDESSSVAVVDFRFVNPANYPFIVSEVNVSIEDQKGATIDGATVSEPDAKRLFEYYPVLGQKFNDSLLMRDKIAAHSTMDRMIVARFEVPEAVLEKRKNLRIKIADVDGPEAELVELRP